MAKTAHKKTHEKKKQETKLLSLTWNALAGEVIHQKVSVKRLSRLAFAC